MGRTPCCAEGLKKGAWTSDEDQKLIAYSQEHGEGGWRTLPQKAGLQRCGKSCRLRWASYLRPYIKRGKFRTEEEQKIIQLQASLGNRWSAIARHLPKRTDSEIKNYWNTHLKKRLADISSSSPTFGFDLGDGSDYGSSSSSTSAHILNKLASELAPSLKTAQDLFAIRRVESSSPVSFLDSPTTRRVSTSVKLLNKLANRLDNTLKCILLKSTDQDNNNTNDDNYNNDNYLQHRATASNLSESSTLDISRSISTSNHGGVLVDNNNNNSQEDDSNFTTLLDLFDFDILKDW